MVRNALRTELAALLAAPEGYRNPALRRSLRAEWLYAADLPALYGGNIPAELLRCLAEAGWESAPDGGWLQLRKPAPEPPAGWYGGPFGPEAACCLSLLKRHLPCDGDPEAAQRTLIKAGEEGSAAYEAACCLSLLKRHLPCDGDPEPAQRTLIKAGEEGPAAYEAACAALHREWADRLRKGEPLPEISLRYFGA